MKYKSSVHWGGTITEIIYYTINDYIFEIEK